MSRTSQDRLGRAYKLCLFGLAAAWTAQYLRVWPLPHWSLNTVYLLWIAAGVALFVGYPAVRDINRGVVTPSDVEKERIYRRRKALGSAGTLVLVLLFAAPWTFEIWRPDPAAQIVLILSGWIISIALIIGLHFNRRARLALLSGPALP